MAFFWFFVVQLLLWVLFYFILRWAFLIGMNGDCSGVEAACGIVYLETDINSFRISRMVESRPVLYSSGSSNLILIVFVWRY